MTELAQEYLEAAKDLLRAELVNHDDPGVRAMAQAFDLADDNPSVVSDATALQRKARMS